MIWLTWRQHRAAIIAIALVVAILGAIFIVTGHQMADAFQQLGVGDCLAHPTHPNCGESSARFAINMARISRRRPG